MESVGCGAATVSERNQRSAQRYRRFRCRARGRPFNERRAGILGRAIVSGDKRIDCVPVWTGNILDAGARLMAHCPRACDVLGTRGFQLVGIGQRLAVNARWTAG
jgi:hypothetical protein